MSLSGNPLDYFIVLLGGILVSFGPCVYPFIPVSIGIIGISPGTSRLKGLLLSITYVSGIAVVYSSLGLAASLTGMVFGTLSALGVTNLAVGIIFILFGLYMLGLIKIPLPQFLKPAAEKGKRGYLSVFLLGMVSGLVMSPCVTPVLGAILAYLATNKNIFYGMTLLLTFAYGMGLSLILAGTFSSILFSLPKPGKWMLYATRIAALILIITGGYFIFTGLNR